MKCRKKLNDGTKCNGIMEKVKQYKSPSDYYIDINFIWIWKCPYCGSKEKFRFGRNARWGDNNEN